jgi:ABC-type nitrate/sulfonate/bicarbonate transport system substrate-binding protein
MPKKLKEFYYTPCPVETLSHVALSQGFFKKTLKELGTEIRHISLMPKDQWNSHFTHRSPNLVRDGGNIPPIWTRSTGADTFLIGLTFTHRKQVLFSKRELVHSVEQLRGKKLALPKRVGEPIDFWQATLLRGSLSILEIHGLSEKDVTFVDLNVPDGYLSGPSGSGSIWTHQTDGATFHQQEFLALKNNLVDAMYSEGARVANLEKSPELKILYTLSDHPDLLKKINICLPCTITVSGNLVREYPEVVQAYMDALVQSAKWAKTHREEVLNIWAKELYLDREFLENTFPPNVNELLMPRLDEEGIRAVETEMNFLFKYHFIEKTFNLSEWTRDDFLKRSIS